MFPNAQVVTVTSQSKPSPSLWDLASKLASWIDQVNVNQWLILLICLLLLLVWRQSRMLFLLARENVNLSKRLANRLVEVAHHTADRVEK